MNPGGPGGSGITQLRGLLPLLQETYGTTHNFVSFDPRGVNVSGPSLSCFPDDLGIVSITDSLVSGGAIASQQDTDAYYRAQALAERCNIVLGGTNGSAKYANTPAVATDMLTFIEAEARSIGQDPGQAKLRYLGFSYGTVLGQTFASMFPDRIDRMILDGVKDGEDYYKGTWSNDLYHADEAVETFFKYCNLAGPEKCIFYETSPEAISIRLQNLFKQLEAHPILIGDPKISPIPTLATSAELRGLLQQLAYFPLTRYPGRGNGYAGLPQILVDLENGNGTSLIVAANAALVAGSKYNESYDESQAGSQILCMDSYARRVNLTTLSDYQAYISLLKNQSTWLGPSWSSQRTSCVALQIVPPVTSQFTGPLPPSASNISFPILFAGNSIDPATPIENAYKVSRGFPGSAVVVQNTTGHTTQAALSKCLAKIFQAYLVNGTMPVSATVCQPDLLPFGLKPMDTAV